ncbi:tetratricopeptide repeat protein [Burkholderia sp. Ax-1719]|uniref:tetratricopeptide repeat protein n=1 Tax=Burkholderia sp. Ax-1719 TaxID=2608334 RepID=UPI00141F2E07|nr:tetratricopeptide repeat protein [Burkholderia sp. Ax-1719]NIE64355.1 hypothetical protein [Burkholderia sp. Ax-1719]
MSTLDGQRDATDGHTVAMETKGVEAAMDPALAQGAQEVGTMRGKIRALISASTRFTPEDVDCVAEHTVDQALTVEVRHTLNARTKSIDITGHFVPSSRNDQKSDQPYKHAAAQVADRLRLAKESLGAALKRSGTAYDFASEDSLYLGHAGRFWNLNTCTGCLGRGKNRCSRCYGNGYNTCHTCSGTRETACSSLGCLFGKKSCSNCNGSGSVSREVGYTTYITVTGPDGISRSESRYQTRYETHPCTAYGCLYGKVTCGQCNGTSRVSCRTCSATGRLVCGPCQGSGNIVCGPCQGSGKTGTCAWTDVHGSQEYRLSFADEIDPRATEIEAKLGLHGVAAQSAGLTLTCIGLDHDAYPRAVTANYAATLRIAHLDAVCNQRDYHLVAYGQALEWLDLDNMVETLLRTDLEALRNALVIASGEGIFATSVQTLANPLHQMVQSEINTEIVEATLAGAALDTLHVLTSAEYVAQVHDSMLAALRQIYTREAKRLAWRIPLIVAAPGIGVGVLAGGGWAALTALASIPVAGLVFKRRVSALLAKTLGGEQQGERALNLVLKGRKHRFAQTLIGAPLAAVSALLLLFPLHGLWGNALTPPATSMQAGVPPAPTTAQSAEVAAAMALRRQGQNAQARAMLRQQAEAGKTEAFGPYAVSLMYDDDHHSLAHETPQLRAQALQWAQRGVQANPGDPVSLEAAGELLTSDWHHKPDMRNGLPALNSAANLGNTDAMHLLGMIYGSGRAVPQNLGEARKWFALSANAGQAVDMYNLGLMDWYGYGMPQADREEAMRLWKQAAAQGEARAIRAVAQGHPPV